MKTFIVAALIVVFATVAFSDEEKRFFGCGSDQDCDEGECCTRYGIYGKCRKNLEEGALCFSRGFGKRGFGLKLRCGCGEGLTCKKSGYFFKRCTAEEGSGDM